RLDALEGQTRELEAEKRSLASEAQERVEKDDKTKGAEDAASSLLSELRSGDREKAFKDFQTLDFAHLTPFESEILRGEVERYRAQLAREHFEKGTDLYRSKQYKRAEQEFKDALEVQKNSELGPETLYYLGMIHYNLGNLPDAVDELQRARDDSPHATWKS